jgi:rubrerythrin
MFGLSLSAGKRSFDSLSEQEILGLAISSEEDDARIYLAYADQLRATAPQSAKVFEDMAEVENTHRNMLIEKHREHFGERIPLIRREHVRGFYDRKPDWLRKNLTLDQIRTEAQGMEQGLPFLYRSRPAHVGCRHTKAAGGSCSGRAGA